jgi:hypothetical protein
MTPYPLPNDATAMLEIVITEPYTPARGWVPASGPDGTVTILHVEDGDGDRPPTDDERASIASRERDIVRTFGHMPDAEPFFIPDLWSIR